MMTEGRSKNGVKEDLLKGSLRNLVERVKLFARKLRVFVIQRRKMKRMMKKSERKRIGKMRKQFVFLSCFVPNCPRHVCLKVVLLIYVSFPYPKEKRARGEGYRGRAKRM